MFATGSPRCIALVLTVLLAVGCGRPGERASDSASMNGTATTGASTAATDAPLATENAGGCERDTVARHADPRALAEEWVRRDAEGAMERDDIAERWIANALTCIEVATSDHGEVISDYTVLPLEAGPDTARFIVRRQREYRVALDSARARLVPDRRTWTDTMVVVRLGRQGWRIDRMAAGVHALPGHAISAFGAWSPVDSAALESLATRNRWAGGGGA